MPNGEIAGKENVFGYQDIEYRAFTPSCRLPSVALLALIYHNILNIIIQDSSPSAS
jgi:hypothetical protein